MNFVNVILLLFLCTGATGVVSDLGPPSSSNIFITQPRVRTIYNWNVNGFQPSLDMFCGKLDDSCLCISPHPTKNFVSSYDYRNSRTSMGYPEIHEPRKLWDKLRSNDIIHPIYKSCGDNWIMTHTGGASAIYLSEPIGNNLEFTEVKINKYNIYTKSHGYSPISTDIWEMTIVPVSNSGLLRELIVSPTTIEFYSPWGWMYSISAVDEHNLTNIPKELYNALNEWLGGVPVIKSISDLEKTVENGVTIYRTTGDTTQWKLLRSEVIYEYFVVMNPRILDLNAPGSNNNSDSDTLSHTDSTVRIQRVTTPYFDMNKDETKFETSLVSGFARLVSEYNKNAEVEIYERYPTANPSNKADTNSSTRLSPKIWLPFTIYIILAYISVFIDGVEYWKIPLVFGYNATDHP